jgi:hypothetical protein
MEFGTAGSEHFGPWPGRMYALFRIAHSISQAYMRGTGLSTSCRNVPKVSRVLLKRCDPLSVVDSGAEVPRSQNIEAFIDGVNLLRVVVQYRKLMISFPMWELKETLDGL